MQRNKGIDGFLPQHFQDKPIPIKIQKKNEDLNDSILLLQNAIKSKNLKFGIVIKTHTDNLLFESEVLSKNILVISHFELMIEKWLNSNK